MSFYLIVLNALVLVILLVLATCDVVHYLD